MRTHIKLSVKSSFLGFILFFASLFLFSSHLGAATINLTPTSNSGTSFTLIEDGMNWNGYYDSTTTTRLDYDRQDISDPQGNMSTYAEIGVRDPSDDIVKPIWAKTETTLSTSVVNGATSQLSLSHTAMLSGHFQKIGRPIEDGHFQGSGNRYEITGSWEFFVTSDFLNTGDSIAATLNNSGNVNYFGEGEGLFLYKGSDRPGEPPLEFLWSWYSGDVSYDFDLIVGDYYTLFLGIGVSGGQWFRADGRDVYPEIYTSDAADYIDNYFLDFTLTISENQAPVPVPGSMMLLISGLVLIAGFGRKKTL